MVSVINQYGKYLSNPQRAKVIAAVEAKQNCVQLSGGLAEIVEIATHGSDTITKVEIIALEGKNEQS